MFAVWNLSETRRPGSLVDSIDKPTDFEQIYCPVKPGHRRGGRRLTPLSVVVRRQFDDFMWTSGFSDFVVSERVLEVFAREGVTGYETRSVKVRFRGKVTDTPPPLWELIVMG